jgi:hypothetical protein
VEYWWIIGGILVENVGKLWWEYGRNVAETWWNIGGKVAVSYTNF